MMLYKDIEKLVKLLEASQVDELEWEKNKERVRLKKTPLGAVAVSASASTPALASVPAPAPPPVAAPLNGNRNGGGKEVSSPFVGTFYESPAPGSKKYVQVGQAVNKGDVLCIIEAMKIMNEIEAEFSGKVTDILVKDGQAVQFGQPIFFVDPS